MTREKNHGSGSLGPLTGLRIIELANIGPTAHAATMLGDLGADVVRVQRPDDVELPDHMLRGRQILEADLKEPDAVAGVLDLTERADVLLEGFRPGVAERLGLGPEFVCARNPRVIYARLTAWGQTGPRRDSAAHDINIVAPTGILHAMGPSDSRPTPPLNLIGGFGGGSMFAVTGILAALWDRQTSGKGQIVDVAMAEGALMLAQHAWSLRATGYWSDTRGTNVPDGSCPFWDTYECSDGAYMAVGAFEPKFYSRLLEVLGLDRDEIPAQDDRARWPQTRDLIAARFARHSREYWTEAFSDADACVTPVLSFAEAAQDPHFADRNSILEIDGAAHPAPAPRFSRTPTRHPRSPVPVTADQIWAEPA